MARNSTDHYFKPGNSGRPKGTKNKPKKEQIIIENFAKHIVEGGQERFIRELNRLHGRGYVDAYLSLFEYVRPKLSRQTVVGDPEMPIRVQNLSNEELNTLLELQNKLKVA